MAINDAKAAKTAYEKFLLSHKVPRQFWKHGVAEVEFLHHIVTRKMDGTKKKAIIREVTEAEQAKYWEGLKNYLANWSPDSPTSTDDQFVVICCEDEKTAQQCLFTLAHIMLTSLFKKQTKYRMITLRNYELWKLLQWEESIDLPNVVVVPSLMAEITSAQYSTLRELFTMSFRVFAATYLSPQEFFDRFSYLPTQMYYVGSIKSVVSTGL